MSGFIFAPSGVSDPLSIGSVYTTTALRANTVEIIVNASKPTVRGNGNALIADDIWIDTANNIIWFWNGTYWLSHHRFYLSASTNFSASTIALNTTERIPILSSTSQTNFFLETMTWNTSLAGLDATNYWSIQSFALFTNGNTTSIGSAVNLQQISNNSGSQNLNVVVANNSTTNQVIQLQALITKFASASNITNFVVTFAGRVIAP